MGWTASGAEGGEGRTVGLCSISTDRSIHGEENAPGRPSGGATNGELRAFVASLETYVGKRRAGRKRRSGHSSAEEQTWRTTTVKKGEEVGTRESWAGYAAAHMLREPSSGGGQLYLGHRHRARGSSNWLCRRRPGGYRAPTLGFRGKAACAASGTAPHVPWGQRRCSWERVTMIDSSSPRAHALDTGIDVV